MKTNNEMPLSFIILAIALGIIFGSNAAATKIAFDGFGVLTSAALRFFTAAAVIFTWSAATGKSLKTEKKYFKKYLVMTAVFSVQVSLMFWGISQTDVSRAAILINLQPFFVLILAHLLIAGDRITFRKSAGMIIGFCGVLPLFVLKKGIAADFMAGDVMLVTAAFLWACNAVYFKTFIQNISVVAATFYHLLLSAPIFLAGAFIFDSMMFREFSAQAVCAILYQGVTTAFGFIAWNLMIKKFHASLVHSFLFMVPATGVVLGILVLGEPFTANILFALILLTVGTIIIHYSKKPYGAVENTLSG